jgi:hypothetical protein
MTIGPRLVKAGIVLTDPISGAVQQVIALQYNPDTLSRSIKPRFAGGSGDHQLTATRFAGAPVETLKVDAEIDATDQLASGDPAATAAGIHPQLALLETLVHPGSAALLANARLAAAGRLEVLPVVAPLPLFVWSKQRIAPVQVTDLSITEEAFDTRLNPIRAKVSLSMRVLTVDDLRFGSPGGAFFITYLQAKERLAGRAARPSIGTLGVASL